MTRIEQRKSRTVQFIKVFLADYLLSNIQKLLHLYSCNAHGLKFRRKLTGAANLQIVYLIEKKQNTRTLHFAIQ